MNIKEELSTLAQINIGDDVYKKLLENCYSTLLKGQEIHSLSVLCASKPDVIKETYALLLKVIAEFGRHSLNHEDVKTMLINKSSFNANKATIFTDLYLKNKNDLQLVLGNIGSHLLHVTDVTWKIDYIVKTTNLSQADGPFFRISLTTSYYDQNKEENVKSYINFTCNVQELQQLVYKLKDIVRHCHRLSVEH